MKRLLSLALCLILLAGAVLVSCDISNLNAETSAETTAEQTTLPDTVAEIYYDIPATNPTGTTASTPKETTAPTSNETTASTSKETSAEIPDGYKLFSDGYISFVYPKTWSKTEGSVTLLQDNSNGNNITVVYEAKTDYYDDLTVTKFNSELKPLYEAMGMSISNADVKQQTNRNGINITRLSYIATAAGKSTKQTAFIFTIDTRAGTITVTLTVTTEMTSDTDLLNNVFDSLTVLKSDSNESSKETTPDTSEATDASVPNGYKLYSDEYISIVYPKTWDKTEGSVTLMQDKSNGDNITIAYETKTDYYDDMTVAQFNSELKPVYEAMGMSISNADVKHQTNQNGIKITKLSYTATVAGTSIKQTALIFTVSDRTYSVNVTETISKPELVTNVFNSITALK